MKTKHNNQLIINKHRRKGMSQTIANNCLKEVKQHFMQQSIRQQINQTDIIPYKQPTIEKFTKTLNEFYNNIDNEQRTNRRTN